MKSNLFLVASILTMGFSNIVFAGSAEDIAKVQHLANKRIMGSDVRKVVQIYNNSDGNPCAELGLSYVVKVQIRKSEFGPNGAVDQARKWEDFNTYYISKAALDRDEDLSDTLCGE